MDRKWFALVVGICCLAGPLQSFAGQVNEGSYEDNRLDALHFRPAEGRFDMSLNATTYLNESQTSSKNGSTVDTWSRTEWESVLNMEYGITDLIQVGISENYLYGQGTTRTQASDNSTATEISNGFSDPTLRFDYRYWGGLTGTHFGSAFLYITPAFGSHKVPDYNTQIGNNLSVSTEAELGTNLYWVVKNHEFSLTPNVEYYSGGTSNDYAPKNSFDTNSYWVYGVSGSYRFHFMQNFYAQVLANLIGSYSETMTYGNRSPQLVQSESYPMRVNPSLILGWKVAPQFLLSAEYTYESYSETVTPTSGSSSPSTDDNFITSQMTVTALYLF